MNPVEQMNNNTRMITVFITMALISITGTKILKLRGFLDPTLRT